MSILDEAAAKVAALKDKEAQVLDHLKNEKDVLVTELRAVVDVHTAEVAKAVGLLDQVVPRMLPGGVQVDPVVALLAARTKWALTKAWLKKNWRVVLYVLIAGVLVFDLFKG